MPGLATSEEIYHQLRWDPGIPEERVVIVYDDHRVGLRRLAFSEFTPGGRIPWSRLWRYELDGVVIWDRAARIDRVKEVRQERGEVAGAPAGDGFVRISMWQFVSGTWQIFVGEGAALPEGCSVLTLNVLFDTHAPERLDTPRRTAALLELLARLQPTLIALQEVKANLLSALLASEVVRSGYFVSDGPAGDMVRPYGPLLLSRVPPDRIEQLRHSQTKRSLVARFGGLSVAVVHLTSDRARQPVAQRSEQLRQLRAGLSGDALIVGDLNFGDEHTEPQLDDFTDLWPLLNPDDPGLTYDPERNALAAALSPTGRARRLDRVLLRAAPAAVVPVSVGLTATEPLPQADPPLFVSDHFGLLASLRLGAAQQALAASPTTHRSAVALIPPRSQWAAIQAIRRVHDPSFDRWMPHINLLYGFLPEPLLAAAAARLSEALREHRPARITLDRIGRFDHPGSTTLTLVPDPASNRWLRAVQEAMVTALPQCTEQDRGGVFTPHLTLARCRPAQADALQRLLQEEGLSVSFEADRIDLISRRGGEPFAERRALWLSDGRTGAAAPSPRTLAQTLSESGRVMTPGQRRLREAVVAKIAALTGGPVLTLGSAGLSVDGPGSDLDLLAITHQHRGRLRAAVRDAFKGRSVDAVVPVVKLAVGGVAVDVLIARYPADLPLVSPDALTAEQRDRLDPVDAMAAAGVLEAAAIRAAVSDRAEDYRLALRGVRAWAAARQIDAHALGYPGGISWAILLAATPPQSDALQWIEAMLGWLLEWDGAPVGIAVPPGTTHPDPACILTTAPPRVNSVRNMLPTTLSVLRDEVARGLEGIWEIREGRQTWAAFLQAVDPTAEPARIELSVVGVSGAARAACLGWLSGHILGLLIDLQRRPGLPMRPYAAGPRGAVVIGFLRAPEGEERVKIAESVAGFVARFEAWTQRPDGAELRWSLV